MLQPPSFRIRQACRHFRTLRGRIRGARTPSLQFIYHRFDGFAFYFYAAERAHLRLVSNSIARFFAHNDGRVKFLVQAFEAGSEVYGIADYSELDLFPAADVSEDHRAGIHADADRNRSFSLRGPMHV